MLHTSYLLIKLLVVRYILDGHNQLQCRPRNNRTVDYRMMGLTSSRMSYMWRFAYLHCFCTYKKKLFEKKISARV